jgi:hypothetical protein
LQGVTHRGTTFWVVVVERHGSQGHSRVSERPGQ